MKQPIRMLSTGPVRLFLALCMGWASTHGLSADERSDAAIATRPCLPWIRGGPGRRPVGSLQGAMQTSDGNEGTVDIIFMKPYYQLIVVEVEQHPPDDRSQRIRGLGESRGHEQCGRLAVDPARSPPDPSSSGQCLGIAQLLPGGSTEESGRCPTKATADIDGVTCDTRRVPTRRYHPLHPLF